MICRTTRQRSRLVVWTRENLKFNFSPFVSCRPPTITAWVIVLSYSGVITKKKNREEIFSPFLSGTTSNLSLTTEEEWRARPHSLVLSENVYILKIDLSARSGIKSLMICEWRLIMTRKFSAFGAAFLASTTTTTMLDMKYGHIGRRRQRVDPNRNFSAVNFYPHNFLTFQKL